jgi:hypothetical protein
MPTTIKSRVTWVTIVSIVFVIGAFIYWRCNSTQAPIRDVRNKVVSLANCSVNDTFSVASTRAEIASVRNVMKGRNTNQEIEGIFNELLAAWQKPKTGLLSEKDADMMSKRLEDAYEPQLKRYRNQANNELLAMGIISLIFITFLSLAVLSNVLRDATGDPAPRDIETSFRRTKLYAESGNTDSDVSTLPPYSLSRTQLAVWITIIGCVYTYAIFWDNLSLGAINNTALLLMGISGGTFAVGAILDTTEIAQKIPRHQDIYKKGNFFKDILSDKDGISIHRFQNVVWTVIAIFVYFYKYGNQPAGPTAGLPELDQTLIALTGISSATYLVLKARENMDPKKPVKVNITLSLEDGPEKNAILATANVLKTATIDVINSAGEVSHAKTIDANPNVQFEAVVEPGQLYKFDVKWEGTVKVNNQDVNLVLKGHLEDTINAEKSITIPLQKQS